MVFLIVLITFEPILDGFLRFWKNSVIQYDGPVRFVLTVKELKALTTALQQAAEKAPYFIWLKLDDKA